LVGKFAHELFLLDNKCKTNKESQGKCEEPLECDLDEIDTVYKVSDYWHVGGAYGSCTEEAMMEELHKNGPLVASFEPSYEFMVYGSGIYSQGEKADWVLNGGQQPEWTKVDHSVLLYGWGEEEVNGKVVKYWMLQNSWGNEWGEQVEGETNGFFRMQRGVDSDGIESIAEASIPVPTKVKKDDENYKKLENEFFKEKKMMRMQNQNATPA
jgi:cathepsin C